MNKYREFSTQLELGFSDEEEAVLEGYFIKYNSPAPAFDNYMEQIDPGALENNGRDIRCLYNHNHDLVLGRESAGTLTLENRPDGLYGRCIVNLDDSEACNIYSRVKRGDITGCSFGAYIHDETVDKERELITLKSLDVIEVSVCPFPFYEDTTMNARSRVENSNLNELKLKFLRRRLKNAFKGYGA